MICPITAAVDLAFRCRSSGKSFRVTIFKLALLLEVLWKWFHNPVWHPMVRRRRIAGLSKMLIRRRRTAVSNRPAPCLRAWSEVVKPLLCIIDFMFLYVKRNRICIFLTRKRGNIALLKLCVKPICQILEKLSHEWPKNSIHLTSYPSRNFWSPPINLGGCLCSVADWWGYHFQKKFLRS